MATSSTKATTEKTDDKAATVESPAIPDETKLDSSVEKPSTTAPGDGPADTTDPTETASSVTPSPDATALAVGTVNAVVPTTKPAAKASKAKARTERYKATKPDGSEVMVQRNIDTGATEVVD
ncbi:hypothetical protein [Frigoribacterium sp. PhB24]|uniref:hypothetical protein n=1 Tax=Frigoribacterium sp. PhB24 TaxID=2485204 RepID=UPI000F48F9C1|nr:hypothetical protein [Frigoribacterium sp. PhB24]ROS52932.1 hypothetical protein EDF50_1408 [Frigoribacterium sp. PhB24]